MFDRGEVRALTFDIFGTCVDWLTAVAREIRMIAPEVDAEELAVEWRRLYAPAMARVNNGERVWAKLDVLHRESLDELLPAFHLERLSSPARERLVSAWHRLDPWPDAAAGLERLRRSHVLATLSNGNVSLLVNLIRHAGLRFDAVLSAELARSYKPAPAVYSMALDLLDLRPEQALMVAAHADDLEAAAAVGMRTAFVSRPAEWGGHQPVQPPPGGHFDIQAADFADLARQLGA